MGIVRFEKVSADRNLVYATSALIGFRTCRGSDPQLSPQPGGLIPNLGLRWEPSLEAGASTWQQLKGTSAQALASLTQRMPFLQQAEIQEGSESRHCPGSVVPPVHNSGGRRLDTSTGSTCGAGTRPIRMQLHYGLWAAMPLNLDEHRGKDR